MISFYKENSFLLLRYEPDNGLGWIKHRFELQESFSLKKTFQLSSHNLTDKGEEELNYNYDENPFVGDGYINFILGVLYDDYYKLDRLILGLNNNLFIYKDKEIRREFFTASQNISVFDRIDKLVKEDIYIGGDNQNAIPIQDFENLLSGFPNSYEIRKYADARVSTVLRNYIGTTTDAQTKYKKYMNKKVSQVGEKLIDSYKEVEYEKYKSILEKLQNMLDDEDSYNEKQWQNEILDIILLLHPKYITVMPNALIKDVYNDTHRYLDFLLVDSSGHVDIIEIKQPFDNCIMTNSQYRDNFIPMRELSGTIMQVEKYILYLKGWAKAGEKYLSEKYKNILPENFKIKIINPMGIIIMGRETKMSKEQLEDFEVVKRKYKNVADIITYDDLIRRLKSIIERFEELIF